MAIRNMQNPSNPTEWVNLTDALRELPVPRNILGDLGIFVPEYLNSRTVVIPKTTSDDYIMKDIPWGTRVQNTQRDRKATLTLSVPHMAVEDAILPLDIQGKIDWDNLNLPLGVVPETLDKEINRKMMHAKRNVAQTWSKAFMHLVLEGTAYAPNGTVVTNYYTEFNVTRSDVTLNLNEVDDPADSIYTAKENIQDNFKGGFVPNSFICLLGRDAFKALARNPTIIDHLGRYGSGRQSVEILTANLGTQGYNLKKQYEVIEYAGVTFIKVEPAEGLDPDEGRMFPTDVPQMFTVFFAPSDRNFDTVNETASEAYFYTKMSEDRDEFKIIYETNPLVACLWPKALIRIVANYDPA